MGEGWASEYDRVLNKNLIQQWYLWYDREPTTEHKMQDVLFIYPLMCLIHLSIGMLSNITPLIFDSFHLQYYLTSIASKYTADDSTNPQDQVNENANNLQVHDEHHVASLSCCICSSNESVYFRYPCCIDKWNVVWSYYIFRTDPSRMCVLVVGDTPHSFLVAWFVFHATSQNTYF